jgi:CBS-domain-containing membrane protein
MGSSTCIIFLMPHSPGAHPRYLFWGYLVAFIVGLIFYYFSIHISHTTFHISPDIYKLMLCALAMGVAIFIMATLNIFHPPAAGFAVGLVLEKWNGVNLLILFLYLILLITIYLLLKKRLKDLV